METAIFLSPPGGGTGGNHKITQVPLGGATILKNQLKIFLMHTVHLIEQIRYVTYLYCLNHKIKITII